MSRKKIVSITFLVLLHITCHAQKSESYSLKKENITAYGITYESGTYKGKEGLIIQQTNIKGSEHALALLKNTNFHNGIIEIDLAGQPKQDAPATARGFVGIAFRIPRDTSKFELIYIRPTNGRADDQVRRNHSTQYVSHPGYPWEKLRKESTEKYESYADILPGEWTKIKIEIIDEKARLYINSATQPSLIVNDLKQGKDLRGSIALWIGPGTLAQFADLRIKNFD